LENQGLGGHWLVDLKKLKDPADYPKNYAVLVDHFRCTGEHPEDVQEPQPGFSAETIRKGKSCHLDRRRKVDNYLEGSTLAHLPKGAITESVDTLEEARYWQKRVKWKFRPDMDPTEKVVVIPKAKQPLVWLNIREVVFPPGSVGATRFEEGVFLTRDEGMLYPGVQKPYFKEYFFDMKDFKGRYVERLIAVRPEWEKPPKAPLQWQAWFNMKDQTPYLLSRRGRLKRDIVPPDEESWLPPEWEKKINPKFRWWLKDLTREEKLNRLDLAYNDLVERGLLKTKPIEVKQHQIEVELKKARGIYRRHWWKGPVIIRGMPIDHWDLVIHVPGRDYLDEWYLEDDILRVDNVPAIYRKCKKPPFRHKSFLDWLTFEGAIPPGKIGNPNKDIPAFMEIIDSFDLEWIEESANFHSFLFKGEKLKGYYIMKRADPRSPIWVFSKSQLPGEKRES